MTNVEKYLKDGVDIEELYKDLKEECGNRAIYPESMKRFFKKLIKPTLTEDEKVILRNIENYKEIGRDNDGDLYLQYNCKCFINSFFGHLFQFIQLRRRI